MLCCLKTTIDCNTFTFDGCESCSRCPRLADELRHSIAKLTSRIISGATSNKSLRGKNEQDTQEVYQGRKRRGDCRIWPRPVGGRIHHCWRVPISGHDNRCERYGGLRRSGQRNLLKQALWLRPSKQSPVPPQLCGAGPPSLAFLSNVMSGKTDINQIGSWRQRCASDRS